VTKERNNNSTERGFTLVELLIVIVILGILAGIVVFAVGNLTSNAKTTGCNAEKVTVQHAVEAYKAFTGVYPTAVDLLTGNATTTPAPGTLLKKVPASYTLNDSGVVSAIPSNAAGCT
jgi:prepilin-type N-terminal cleavage/methylation domain-containing protein